MDYWLPTVPNSSFAFPVGQAISRTTYAALFALMGNTFGAGDGSTTFNLPDKRGRSSSCVDNMGGVTANRLAAGSLAANRHTVGAAGVGGTDAVALVTANLPPYTPAGSVSVTNGAITIAGQGNVIVSGSGTGVGGGGAFGIPGASLSASQAASSGSFTGTAQGGTSTVHDNMQPTILCNYIMRII
jgi:microcystin-dependent protein